MVTFHFIFYGTDYIELTEHIKDAQFEKALRKRANRHSWTPFTKPECKGLVGDAVDGTKQCDEYPFGSSVEGGNANYGKGLVSLRPIDADQNHVRIRTLSRNLRGF